MAEETGSILNILVVEDNPADVQLLRWALEAANLRCNLTVITDGGDALAYARRSAELYDGLILDLNLPKNDGVEIFEALCSNSALAPMPVIVLSSSSAPREKAKLEHLGVEGYLTKPIELDEYLRLGSVIGKIIAKTKSEKSQAATPDR